MYKRFITKKNIIFTLIGILILCIGFGVWIKSTQKKSDPVAEAVARYKLPDDFSKSDVQDMIRKMSEDSEFEAYFLYIRDDKASTAVAEAIDIILNARTSEEALNAIKEGYARIRGISSTFYHLEFGREFSRNPENYPQLQNAYWVFLTEEFKLTILGVYYKVHFDPQFSFQWDEISWRAALKLREIYAMRQEYLKNAGR